MHRNDLLAALDAEGLPLQDGPDPAANVPIGHPIELAAVADAAGSPELPRLLVDQEELQVLGRRLRLPCELPRLYHPQSKIE